MINNNGKSWAIKWLLGILFTVIFTILSTHVSYTIANDKESRARDDAIKDKLEIALCDARKERKEINQKLTEILIAIEHIKKIN